VIVLDASAALEWLLQTSAGIGLEQSVAARAVDVHAPHLIDLEVTQALRRFVRQRLITADRALVALQDLQDLRIVRYPHDAFLLRIWQLRENLTAYDAAYVALAQELRAILVTRDRRLAAAAARRVKVEVI
jgi:predicted nucleic acid-binding protein